MNDLGMRMALTLGLMGLALAAAPVAAERYIVEPVGDVIDARADASDGFSQAELDQMLAPIALYPDSLLSQVLIASTYPLEIVAAARWSRQNPQLDGEEAVAAVVDRDWDPSVKALVAFPELLARLDENLEWTRSLGDAMLFQEAQVMDSIQFLRARADAAGSLETTEFTRVIREERVIIIEPAVTRIVHVPFYDPWIVYGPWWRPMHPPFFWGPPSVFVHSHPGFFWGSGVRVSSGFFFSSFWWPSSNVIIVNNPRFHSPRHRPSWPHYVPGQRWNHSPVHRRGVQYRHPEVRQRYAGHREESRPPARWDGAMRPPTRELAGRDDRGAYRGSQGSGDWSGRNRPGAESGRPQFNVGNVPRRENRDSGVPGREHRDSGSEHRPTRESRAEAPGARAPRSGSVAERPARPDAGALERRIGQSRNDRTVTTVNANRSAAVTRSQAGQPSGTAFRAPQAGNRDAAPTRTPQVINRNPVPTRTPQATRSQSPPRAIDQRVREQRTTGQPARQVTPRATAPVQSQPQRSPAPSAAPAPAPSSRESRGGNSDRNTESRSSGNSRQDSRGNSGRAGTSRDSRSNR